jgi:hypothetical protein
MEGYAYFFICLFWLIEIIGLLASLCAIVFGAASLISKGRKPGCATRWPIGCPIIILVVGSLVFIALGYCAATSIYNDYLDARATCLELPLTVDYKLSIFQRGRNMTSILMPSRGNRYKTDDYYIIGITEYTIEDRIMMGKTAFDDWFWFNLFTAESEENLDEAEYLAALQRLGFAEEPILLPIQTQCQIHECLPCGRDR